MNIPFNSLVHAIVLALVYNWHPPVVEKVLLIGGSENTPGYWIILPHWLQWSRWFDVLIIPLALGVLTMFSRKMRTKDDVSKLWLILVFFGLVLGLWFGLGLGFMLGFGLLGFGLGVGLWAGLMSWLVFELESGSWPGVRVELVSRLVAGLLVGLVFGFVFGLLSGLMSGLVFWLVVCPAVILATKAFKAVLNLPLWRVVWSFMMVRDKSQ